YFHWGFHAWAMYALVGGAIAYAAYRRGRSLLLSSIFVTLFGKRQTEGFAGKLVDIFAIVATLFGTAAALGIAAMQIGTGVSIVSGAGPMTNAMLVVIILVLTLGFIISAVSGVPRRIRSLSAVHIVLTVGIVGLDLFAIVATLFGTAAALGIAAMPIGTGVSIVSGAGPMTNAMLVVIILVLTLGFIISAVSGVSRGIRYLSSINIVLTVGIVGLVLFLGPTLFLFNLLPSALMEYFGSLFDMMGRSLSWGNETQEFQSVWTVYY